LLGSGIFVLTDGDAVEVVDVVVLLVGLVTGVVVVLVVLGVGGRATEFRGEAGLFPLVTEVLGDVGPVALGEVFSMLATAD
jgi:hypothetical protein